ncbi:adenosine kinase [Desulfatitalea tepidiphila]|uniref:adenosine kinase n=1 Tax=Desulfatitalea tepidiphila TaxID=1185843 RepID=UPI0006B4F79D|nr:adenosine kinase [Desulfatitalea tepidiphila]
MSAAGVIGVGSPIVDRLALVEDAFLAGVDGGKGGMALVDTATMEDFLRRVPGEQVMAPGGSAANTIFALARLEVPTVLIGKLGNDAEGLYYRSAFEKIGGDGSRLKTCEKTATARCLSLVTPDSQRTMRTDLGAAAAFSQEEVSAADFHNCRHAHVEGYLLFNRDLSLSVLKTAKAAGCTVSLDLGSFEVVTGAADILPELLARYVDVVMANEDEAEAFCGSRAPRAGLEALSRHCATAVVKQGAQGALVAANGKTIDVPAIEVDGVKDTTGAGDFWAAGFLYGLLNGCRPDVCGHLGAVLGAQAVRHMGAELPERDWLAAADYFKHYLQER